MMEDKTLEQQYQEVQDTLVQLRDPKLTTDKRMAVARDALTRVAPLADQIGLSKEQHDMEELALQIVHPDDYALIKQQLQEAEASCELVFKAFTLPIRSMLDSIGIDYRISMRMKSVYSIWRKIQNKHVTFDEVYDLFALRIVYRPTDAPIESLEQAAKAVGMNLTAGELDREKLDCWRIYTVITSLYRAHPERVRDWITHPKACGYQALQITIMGPDCYWIEVQIRSERMDDEAENGESAHWVYKKQSAGKTI